MSERQDRIRRNVIADIGPGGPPRGEGGYLSADWRVRLYAGLCPAERLDEWQATFVHLIAGPILAAGARISGNVAQNLGFGRAVVDRDWAP